MTTIAVVGLGYVGLPLAVEFGKKYRTIGFDCRRRKLPTTNAVDPHRRSQHGRSQDRDPPEVGCDPAALKEPILSWFAVPA